MVIGSPLSVDFPGAGVELLTAASHLLDDVARIADEDLGVVYRVVRAIENGRRPHHGVLEQRRIDADAMLRTESVIAGTLKCRSGVDQREIDIEEHRSNRRWRRGPCLHDVPTSSYGPATTTVARSVSRCRRATSWICSRVTAFRKSASWTS